MFINSIEIEKYKVLEDIKIEFATQKSSRLENGNIANVIAGVNGCGKTSLLEFLFKTFDQTIDKQFNDYDNSINFDRQKIDKKLLQLDVISDLKSRLERENKTNNNQHSSPSIIYLPSGMVFHYQRENYLDMGYNFTQHIDTKYILGNAELFIKDFIIKEERSSHKQSPKSRAKYAIDKFNLIFNNCEFITKLVDLDWTQMNRPIFETITGDRVFIDELSSGEQQLYARVVSLMILNPQNSIILIDEPEIALHPKWQIDIMKIYLNIGKNNQFIVTTHSPFIISQTHYKNLIFLVKENEKIVSKQFKDAPHRDINTLVKTVMGAEYIPIELQKLQDEYRELFEEEEEETKRGLELKREILEWESSNSSFWQSIGFDEELFLDPTKVKNIRDYFIYTDNGYIGSSNLNEKKLKYMMQLLELNTFNNSLSEERKKSLKEFEKLVNKKALQTNQNKSKIINFLLAKENIAFISFLRFKYQKVLNAS